MVLNELTSYREYATVIQCFAVYIVFHDLFNAESIAIDHLTFSFWKLESSCL